MEDPSSSASEPLDAALAEIPRELATRAEPLRRAARERVRAALFSVPQRPVTIDRFVLVHRLSAGAMGEVWAAWDPRLDRRVALKLVPDDGGEPGRQARLMIEARRLALVTHPNIVAVYDAGAIDDDRRTFVAMELIEGECLDVWIAREHPSHASILDAFLQAAEGLAAAHRAGVVHRDVKPANAMRDAQGRVRLIDFGLARGGVQSRLGASDSRGESPAGTPAYMAPELFVGSPASPASDQFAWCIALCEALWGAHPFDGAPMGLLTGAIDGPRLPPRGMVAAHVRDAVVRGLARAPRERWPGMAELMHAIRSPPPRTRRRAALVVATTVGLGGLAWLLAPATKDCRDHAGDAPPWEELETAVAVERPGAVADDALVVALREHHRRVEAALAGVCTAQPRDAGQHRCLLRVAARFDAVVELLRADVDGAVSAVDALREPDECVGEGSPAADGDTSRELPAHEHDLARAAAMLAAGDPAGAHDLAASTHELAARLGDDRSAAESRLLVADAQMALGDIERACESSAAAHFLAQRSGAPTIAARSAGLAIACLVGRPGGRESAALWLRHADSALSQLRGRTQALTQASVDAEHGWWLHRQGESKQALPLLRAAEATRSAMLPATHAAVLSVRTRLATALVDAGESDAAVALVEDSLAAAEAQLGPEHPVVTSVLHAAARVSFSAGRLERAEELGVRLMGSLARTRGTHNGPYVLAGHNVAVGRVLTGHIDEARETLRELVEVGASLQHSDPSTYLSVLLDYATVCGMQGAAREGLAAARRAVALAQSRAPDDPGRLQARLLAARLLASIPGEGGHAQYELRHLVDDASAFGDELTRGTATTVLAGSLRDAGDDAAAVALYRGELEHQRARGAHPHDLAGIEFELARCVLRMGDAEEARGIAAHALAQHLASPPPTDTNRVRDWATAGAMAAWLADPT